MLPELLTRIPLIVRQGVPTLDEAARYIVSDRFWMQQKCDGERLVVRRRREHLEAWNKLGHAIPVPPKLKPALLAFPVSEFVLDGEYERSVYHCWDLFDAGGVDLATYGYGVRYRVLQTLGPSPFIQILPSWTKANEKERMGFELLRIGVEGVVFKDSEAPYKPGRAGQHFKLKFEKTATVRIQSVDPLRDRAVIEMLDGNDWREVSGIKVKRGTLNPGDFIEVRYLSASEGRRLVQPVFVRVRTDVSETDCSMDQIEFGGRWAHLKIKS